VTTLLPELRQAARRLRRTPGFTLASVLTLGLGVGALTAVYSLVYSTVIRPLPYPQSDELVRLDHAAPGIGSDRGLGMSDGLYAHYTAGVTQLEDIAVWLYADLTLAGEVPRRVRASVATPSFFTALRVVPEVGLPFTDAQASAGEGVTVISHSLWVRRFGRERDVIGRVIRLDGNPVEVVGIMPAGFAFPDRDVDLWVPLSIDPATTSFGGFARGGIARLAPGATRESAEAELVTLLGRLTDRFPEAGRMLEDAQLTPLLPTLKEDTVRESERTLWILLGSVAFVLLLTCANVANLLLVRADGRHRETALRQALGAGRAELARYYLSEGLLLSIAGGVLGVGLAAISARLLVAYGPDSLPRISEVAISPASIALALAISFITSVLFGLLPTLRRLPSLAFTIKSGQARVCDGRADSHGRGVLVATQVALALVLLIATGLMARSFANLVTLDPGFDAEGVLTFSIGLPATDYADRASAVAFHREAVDRLAALPGVETVAVTNCLPLCGSWGGIQLEVEGRPEDPNTVPGVVAMRRVNETYFSALRIRLVAGRFPTRAEHEAGTGPAVISRRLAESYWPNEDPLGQRFRPGSDAPWYEIVGVVEDTPIRALSDDPPPIAYLPLLPGRPVFESSSYELAYVLRTAGPPQALLLPAREVIRSLDPAVPVSKIATLRQLIADSNSSTTFMIVVLGVAAGIALLLGVVGIYGVISYTVGQRANEIGIRMALGARSGEVSRSVLLQGARVTAIGLVVGLFGSFALTRVLRNLLFGVSPTDPVTFTAVPIVLLAVALAATYLPARRAARVDPMTSLRSD